MTDPVTVLSVVAVVLVWFLGYITAIKWETDDGETDDGCNGHHWGEPRPMGCRFDATVHNGNVFLKRMFQKVCEDCNKEKHVMLSVGKMSVDSFMENAACFKASGYEC